MASVDVANKILQVIGATFLTTEEAATLPTDQTDLVGIYDALVAILTARAVPSTYFDKLRAKALLDGVTLTEDEAKKEYGTNVSLGFAIDV